MLHGVDHYANRNCNFYSRDSSLAELNIFKDTKLNQKSQRVTMQNFSYV